MLCSRDKKKTTQAQTEIKTKQKKTKPVLNILITFGNNNLTLANSTTVICKQRFKCCSVIFTHCVESPGTPVMGCIPSLVVFPNSKSVLFP